MQEIRVTVGETQRLMLRNREPKNGLEAKFSIEFAMASALVARQVGLAQLTDRFVQRPDVVEAMTRVACATVPTPGAAFAPSDTVSVLLRSGAGDRARAGIERQGQLGKPNVGSRIPHQIHGLHRGRAG